MTEQDWLAGDDPRRMLAFVKGEYVDTGSVSPGVRRSGPVRVSDRKLRLFACACCRAHPTFGGRVDDAPVRAAECRADGLPLPKARSKRPWKERTWLLADDAAQVALIAQGPFDEDGLPSKESLVPPAFRSALLRDVVGNPLRPIQAAIGTAGALAFHDALEWNGGGVRKLARSAYEERLPDGTLDPVRLAVLADALEEAGCVDWWLLSHLRGEEMCPICLAGPGRKKCPHCHEGSRPLRAPHVRGCWALDFLLEKE